MPKPSKALPGDVFGYLTVEREAEPRIICQEKKRYVLCRCTCGREKEILVGSLLKGCTRSCGCVKRFAKPPTPPTERQDGRYISRRFAAEQRRQERSRQRAKAWYYRHREKVLAKRAERREAARRAAYQALETSPSPPPTTSRPARG